MSCFRCSVGGASHHHHDNTNMFDKRTSFVQPAHCLSPTPPVHWASVSVAAACMRDREVEREMVGNNTRSAYTIFCLAFLSLTRLRDSCCLSYTSLGIGSYCERRVQSSLIETPNAVLEGRFELTAWYLLLATVPSLFNSLSDNCFQFLCSYFSLPLFSTSTRPLSPSSVLSNCFSRDWTLLENPRWLLTHNTHHDCQFLLQNKFLPLRSLHCSLTGPN